MFEAGTRSEPALYADVADHESVDRSGRPEQLENFTGRTVTAASTADGTLQLSFADGSLIRCEPVETHEAWQVVGGDPQWLVVCAPGGELAIWDS